MAITYEQYVYFKRNVLLEFKEKRKKNALVLFARAFNFNKTVFPRFALKISKIKQLRLKNAVPYQVYGNKNLNKHKHSIFYNRIFERIHFSKLCTHIVSSKFV